MSHRTLLRTILETKVAGLAALLFGLVPLLGCPEYPHCKKDADCKAALGEKCVEKMCQNCKTDDDCAGKAPEGQPAFVCTQFRCQAPGPDVSAAAGGEEGDPCTQKTDCRGGLACKAGKCDLCTEDVDCSPGTCNPDSGRCSPEGSCTTDDQCTPDEICDAGMCVFSGNLGDDTGGPCGLAAVYFAFDSDVITPKTQQDLTTAAECITQQNRLVYLEAHADDRGTEEYNILLTERRGEEVKQFLADKGVSPDNMQIIAKGSLEATGKDEAGRAKDRRVQFIWPEQ